MPVTPVDTSIYGNMANPNQGIQTLGNMVNIAGGLQSLQNQKNANVQSGIDAQEMQNLQPVMRNVSAYTDARGNVDFNKFVPLVMQVAPKNGASVISNMADMQQQKALAQNAISGQTSDALQRASNAIFSIDPDKTTPETLQQTADALNQNFTSPAAQQATNQIFSNMSKVFTNTKPGDPLRASALQHVAMMYQPIETQQTINTPTAVARSDQQNTWLQNIKPNVAGVPQNGIIPNSVYGQQLAPDTPVMQGNVPGYLGSTGRAPGAQQNPGFVASGAPLGAARNVQNNVDEMNRHYASLQDSSAGNQLTQALMGNIKTLASKAITGTESDKLSYLNGLLAALPGNGHADDLKTATDLLNKNMAQLNMSTPASSDAARVLIEAGRPNSRMSDKAISDAADQVASQIQANMATRNYLTGSKFANGGQGDFTVYQQQREQIEKVADPRIWQYQNAAKESPAAASEFVKKLSPADANALKTKIRQAVQMGLIQ